MKPYLTRGGTLVIPLVAPARFGAPRHIRLRCDAAPRKELERV